jgi:hypothetical protein
MSAKPSELGPCVICGDVGYELSMGGPSICPSCDCGNFGIYVVKRQAKVIAELRERLAAYERKDADSVFRSDGRSGD